MITVQELQEISGLDVLYLKQWCEGFFRWIALGLAGIQECDDYFDDESLTSPRALAR